MKEIASILTVAIISSLLVGCGRNPTDEVKNGTLEFDKSVTVGKAFDGYKYFKKVTWKEFETPQDRTVVEADGLMDLDAYKGSEVEGMVLPGENVDKAKSKVGQMQIEYIVQFQLSKRDKSFDVAYAALKVSGTGQNGALADQEIKDDKLSALKSVYENRPEPGTWGLLVGMSQDDPAEEQKKAALAEVQKQKEAELAEAKKQIGSLREELAELEKNQVEETRTMEKDFDTNLATTKLALETLRTRHPELTKQLALQKQKYAPLKAELDRLTDAREALESPSGKDVQSAGKSTLNAEQIRDEMLQATCRMINDTIISKSLPIDLLPKDGKFSDGAPRRAMFDAEEVNNLFENDIGETPPVGNSRLLPPGEIVIRAGGVLSVACAPPTEGSSASVQWYRTFPRFPKQLVDNGVRHKFAEAYLAYSTQMIKMTNAERAASNQAASSAEGKRLALQKWDYVNGERFTQLRTEAPELAAQLSKGESALQDCETELKDKEALVAKPREEQVAQTRAEISARFDERRRSIKEKLAKYEQSSSR